MHSGEIKQVSEMRTLDKKKTMREEMEEAWKIKIWKKEKQE